MQYGRRDTQVLIIGAGAAGLRTAIELATNGIDALVVSKRDHGDAHTSLAAGGINAALGTRDEEDDWTLHAADTLREGHFICQPEAVELMARHAPERILELAEWGCPFSRTDDGELDQRYFGAHTYRRTCFVGDRTGRAVLDTLVGRANDLNVNCRQHTYITEIIVEDGRAIGAIGWDTKTGEELVISATAVVVAAGGCTALYNRHSSRYDENTGDAMGLAWAAGATLRDMEFIQFHPTGMVAPEAMKGRLVTEAVRAEGGRLFNADGERFMERYAPDEMELAPRDVVARAIAQEIGEGRGTKDGGVLLDISHRDASYLCRRLPRMYERFAKQGIDISEEPMEVAPTAHYAMGGIKVDFNTGATDVDGLFAVGEATSGLHGANRLGGNSLVETVVFGQLTGAYLTQWVAQRERPRLGNNLAQKRLNRWEDRARQDGEFSPQDLVRDLKDILANRAGIVRDAGELERGITELSELRNRANDLRVYTQPGSKIFELVCNFEFMLDTAEMILRAALARPESRGAHNRSDHPDTDDDWRVSIVCRRAPGGAVMLEREAVEPPSEEVQQAVERELHFDYHHLE